jgi:DNA repair protein RadC
MSDYEQQSFIPSLENEPALELVSEPRPEPAPRDERPYLRRLHEGLAPYLDVPDLRRLVGERGDIYQALRSPDPPVELRAILDILADILHPRPREQIKSPTNVAGLLMVEMSRLDQEELRTVLLDTQNRVQDIVTIYRGSLNTSLIRVGEIYKPAIWHNSAAIVVCHNHPSGSPDPSPEDVLVTRSIVEAGKLLEIECLDHLIIGAGRFVSLREKGAGFG